MERYAVDRDNGIERIDASRHIGQRVQVASCGPPKDRSGAGGMRMKGCGPATETLPLSLYLQNRLPKTR